MVLQRNGLEINDQNKIAMEKFKVSEKYRKYLIELQFKNLSGYVVWGTDMEDDESDKLLLSESRVLIFRDLDNIAQRLENIEHSFRDKENFRNWVAEKGFREVYNVNEIKLLSDFTLDMLSDRIMSLEILNCINLVQDFFIQIKNKRLESLFDEPAIIDVKDFIYNNYFWKKNGSSQEAENIEDTKVIRSIRGLYDVFYRHIEIV